MIFHETAVQGASLIELNKLTDDRGFFARAFCTAEFAEHGLETVFVQSNVSRNRKRGTLRGMHMQADPHGEVKVVRCTRGAVFDAFVDLRPESPTYLQWFGAELSEDNHRTLYIPSGCAHGYLTLCDEAEVMYLVSASYHPESERGYRWNDPAFGIEWPKTPGEKIISDKDSSWPLLKE